MPSTFLKTFFCTRKKTLQVQSTTPARLPNRDVPPPPSETSTASPNQATNKHELCWQAQRWPDIPGNLTPTPPPPPFPPYKTQASPVVQKQAVPHVDRLPDLQTLRLAARSEHIDCPRWGDPAAPHILKRRSVQRVDERRRDVALHRVFPVLPWSAKTKNDL